MTSLASCLVGKGLAPSTPALTVLRSNFREHKHRGPIAGSLVLDGKQLMTGLSRDGGFIQRNLRFQNLAFILNDNENRALGMPPGRKISSKAEFGIN